MRSTASSPHAWQTETAFVDQAVVGEGVAQLDHDDMVGSTGDETVAGQRDCVPEVFRREMFLGAERSLDDHVPLRRAPQSFLADESLESIADLGVHVPGSVSPPPGPPSIPGENVESAC